MGTSGNTRYLLLAIVATVASFLHQSSCRAQAVYAATETGHIQVGAGGLLLSPDYGTGHNKGLALWADYDFGRFLGLEGEYHLGGLIAPGDIGEDTWLIGPRVLCRRRRVTAYARAAAGRGTISNQLYHQSSTYDLYAFGGGVEYKVNRRFNVRAVDFELQKWPHFQPNALSPTVITIGLSYVIR